MSTILHIIYVQIRFIQYIVLCVYIYIYSRDDIYISYIIEVISNYIPCVYNVYIFMLYQHEYVYKRIGGCAHGVKFYVQVLSNEFILLNSVKRVSSKITNL